VDKKSVGGDGASLIVDGIMTGLGPPVPSRTELGICQTDASVHTPLVAWRRWRESPLVGGTSCPPHRQRAEVKHSGPWPRGPQPGPLVAGTNTRRARGHASPITKKSETHFILAHRRFNCWLGPLLH
jgi:hypothetical protein